MTSHPSQSLCARTEPRISDDPQEVGGYRIEGRVSDGGGGVLYAARRGDGEPVLLGLARGEAAGEALPEPADEGVCAVGATETGEHEGRPWSVLPDQPGPDLRRHVAAHGALPEWGAVVLAAAVAEALAVLHGEGTAHGEVGPDTVVLTGAGPRLLDTGLGRRAEAPAEPGLRGVPGWVAPEVYEDGRPTAAADVFGWAALVALAATGREPFGESPASRLGRRAALVEMERRARQDGVDLEGVPESLRGVVARALSPEPGERPSAADALAAALRHLDGRDGGSTAERLRAALPGGGGGASAGPAAGVQGGAAAAGVSSGAPASAEAGAGADVKTQSQTASGGAGAEIQTRTASGGADASAESPDTGVPADSLVTGASGGPAAPVVPSAPSSPGLPEVAAVEGVSGGGLVSGAASDPEAPVVPDEADDPDVTVVTGDSMSVAAADAVAAAATTGGGVSSSTGPGTEGTAATDGPATDGPAGAADADDVRAAEAAAEPVAGTAPAGPGEPVGTLGFGIYTEPETLEGSAVAPSAPAGPPAAPATGFGIYTEPVTPEGSAVTSSAPAGPPAAPATGFGIYTEPVAPEGSAAAGAAPTAAVPPAAPVTGRGAYPSPADPASEPAWNVTQEAAGTTATMVREPVSGGRTALLVNAAVVGAVLLGVLVVMLFRTGVL